MYMFGSWCSKWTRGVLSSALVCGIIMLLCFWLNIFPKDIVEISGMKSVYSIMSAIIIANMGTTLDVNQFRSYWRVALTVIGSLVALTVITLTIGSLIVGHDLALASFPVLMGAMRATQIMTDALNAKNLPVLAAIVVLVNSVQQFFGLPITSVCTKRSATKFLADYRASIDTEVIEGVTSAQRPRLIDKLPNEYKNPFFHLSCIGIIGVAAAYLGDITSSLTNGIVGMPLLALLMGFILQAAGIVENNPMVKSGTMPFFMFATVVGLFSSLASLSFSDFVANIGNILVLLVLGTIALTVGGWLLSKVFKIDPGIGIASAFGAYTGYPLNYQVVQDSINALTSDTQERAYLEEKMAPSVCIGSIISVTITSVIVAGVVATMF